MISLHYTTRDGRILKKAVAPQSILEIEEDPRGGAIQSKSIVKLSNGDKLYCTQTYEELVEQLAR